MCRLMKLEVPAAATPAVPAVAMPLVRSVLEYALRTL